MKSVHTCKKAFIACSPPIIPKSNPYWNGLMMTTPHARNSREWLRHEALLRSVIVPGDEEVVRFEQSSTHSESLHAWVPYTLPRRFLPMAADPNHFGPWPHLPKEPPSLICFMTPQVLTAVLANGRAYLATYPVWMWGRSDWCMCASCRITTG